MSFRPVTPQEQNTIDRIAKILSHGEVARQRIATDLTLAQATGKDNWLDEIAKLHPKDMAIAVEEIRSEIDTYIEARETGGFIGDFKTWQERSTEQPGPRPTVVIWPRVGRPRMNPAVDRARITERFINGPDPHTDGPYTRPILNVDLLNGKTVHIAVADGAGALEFQVPISQITNGTAQVERVYRWDEQDGYYVEPII